MVTRLKAAFALARVGRLVTGRLEPARGRGSVPTRLHLLNPLSRSVSTVSQSPAVIFGIETSCDDTGCAVVTDRGEVLSDVVHSQHQLHLDHGGIIPPIARDLHQRHIERVAAEALQRAGLTLQQVDAVAVTVKPGLPLSLLVGMRYGKHLARTADKPFIPVHHMEAHALTVRMVEDVPFPFLVLLISGGHSLLAVARDVDDFLLLGTTLDDAPGEALDKTSRRLKLRNLPQCSTLSGGQAIELMASGGDPLAFEFPMPLMKYKDCTFSFSGLKFMALRRIREQEERHEVRASAVIPNVADFCASFQYSVARHICHRTQRAMDYCLARGLLETGPEDQNQPLRLVVSGGVACNSYIASCLRRVCDAQGFSLHIPPPRLCTDNGVMIAWNGVEKWRLGRGWTRDLDTVDIGAKATFGTDITDDVKKLALKCNWVKLLDKPSSGREEVSEVIEQT